MSFKRPRSATSNLSPSNKKVVVEPQYKTLGDCTIRRVKRFVPDDVKIVRILIEAQPLREFTQTIERLVQSVKGVNKLGILVGIQNYATNRDPPNHAVAIYKWGDVLYCFDPWGGARRKISSTLFNVMHQVMGTRIMRIYDGINLQAYNAYGVCVGLSSNFIMVMANQKAHIRQHFSVIIRRLLVTQTINNIEQNLQAKTLALSKPKNKNMK